MVSIGRTRSTISGWRKLVSSLLVISIASSPMVLFLVPGAADTSSSSPANVSSPGAFVLSSTHGELSQEIYSGQSRAPANTTGFVSNTLLMSSDKLVQWNTVLSLGNTNPVDGAYDPINHDLYVLGTPNGYLTIFSENGYKVVGLYSVGSVNIDDIGKNVVYDPFNQCMYVLASGITIFNAASNIEVGSLSLGGYSLTVNTNNGDIYLTGGPSVYVISPSTDLVVAQYDVGMLPYDEAYSAWNNCLYVSHSVYSNITVTNLSTGEITHTINMSGWPTGLLYDPVNRCIFVAQVSYGRVSIINTTTYNVTGNVSVGTNPYGSISYDSLNGYLYVGNTFSNSVSVLNGNGRLLSTIAVGNNPMRVITGSTNGIVYVVDFGGDALTLINANPAYPVNFVRNGNLNNATWFVDFNNLTQSTTNEVNSFVETNGTYNFSVRTLSGFSPYPGEGSVKIDGNYNNITIDFRRAYTVTFAEKGLPLGEPWMIDLNGTNRSLATDEIQFQLTNGTYNYTALGQFGPVVYSRSGNITVNGSSLTAEVNFGMSASPFGNTAETSLAVTLAIVGATVIIGAAYARGRRNQ